MNTNKTPLLEYNVIQQTYTSQQDVEVSKYCNGFVARNIGNDTVFINGIQLLPAVAPGLSGETFSIGGNVGEIYRGRIQIVFAGAGLTPLVEIVQKFYIQI